MVDAWWVAVWVYATLLVGQRLWRARRWVPPEWPEADYGWKVTHLLWVPFNVLDVVFGVAAALRAASCPAGDLSRGRLSPRTGGPPSAHGSTVTPLQKATRSRIWAAASLGSG